MITSLEITNNGGSAGTYQITLGGNPIITGYLASNETVIFRGGYCVAYLPFNAELILVHTFGTTKAMFSYTGWYQ
jgi:hypothetical protein